MTDPRLAWFEEARFGLFVHWGLYALIGTDAWAMQQQRISASEYEPLIDYFDPDLFDPRQWAREAVAAGMRYAVLTVKHHEGFCLWDSRLTNYSAPSSPASRDLVAEFVDAFREAGLRIGFYYSLLDWHHPDFTVDGIHPLRDQPDRSALNEGRDMTRYASYVRGQIEELLTDYGRIDYLFFDFSYDNLPAARYRDGKGPRDWDSERLLELVRQLQPGIIVNDRLGIPGDVVTPEEQQPVTAATSDTGRPLM